MTSRAPFLKTAYSGYYHRNRPEEDTELTHVGPGTPGGEYMRRFWQPVIYTEELTDLPVATRILGEDLVVFRDFSGRIGAVEAHCPHRGTSLEYGLVSERGIRCCYHGWLMDVDGTILETPGEPEGSTLASYASLRRAFSGKVFQIQSKISKNFACGGRSVYFPHH